MKKWDIHIHSEYSHDSRTRVRTIFKVAKKAGLDGLIITDHDTCAAFRTSRQCAREFGIETIPGYEYKSLDGDILVLGVAELIPEFLSAREAVIHAREIGAVTVAAHPYDILRVGIGDLVAACAIDGIEIINSRTVFGRKRAMRMAEKLHLALCAGSDAHTRFEVGCAYTTFSGDDILSAIRKRKTGYQGGSNFRQLPLLLGSTFLSTPFMIKRRWSRWKTKRQHHHPQLHPQRKN